MYLFCIINTHFGKQFSYGYSRFYSVTEKLHFVGWSYLYIFFPFVLCIFHEQVLYGFCFENVARLSFGTVDGRFLNSDNCG